MTSADYESVITAITSQVSVESIVGVLAAAAGIAIAFVFLWWGGRKAVSMLMGAFRRGRLSV